MGRRILTAALTVLVLAGIAGMTPGRVAAQSPTDRLSQPAGLPRGNAAAPPSQSVPQTGTSRRGGVTISPAFQQISVDPKRSEVDFMFSVTNNSNREVEFALSVVDFGSLDETGGVLFVGNAEKALNFRYALTPWVTLGKDRIVVPPRATEKVPIAIVNREALPPGGHYGAVLVTPTDSGEGADKKVQIDQVATSLLFVKKLGGEVYRLNVDGLRVRPHIFSLPSSVSMRFQNAGNVHVVPRGLVTLRNPRGDIVRRGVINSNSGIVLPESFRSLQIPLDSVGRAWMPGRYTVTASYRYDDSPAVRSVSTTFLYFHIPFIAVLLVPILIGVAFAASSQLRRSAGRRLQVIGRTCRHLRAKIYRK